MPRKHSVDSRAVSSRRSDGEDSLSPNEQSVLSFFEAISRHDLEAVDHLLASDFSFVVPMSLDGSLKPVLEIKSKPEVLEAQQQIMETFSRHVIADAVHTSSAGGNTIFVEGHGDLVIRETGKPYRNIFVYRFDLEDGQITGIREYANPITLAKAMGMPFG